MKNKPYRSCKDIIFDLKTLIAEYEKEGEKILPSERKLSVMMNASRITISKALKELEAEGAIQRKDKTIVICQKTVHLGSFLFVTPGAHDVCWHHAFERLWQKLASFAGDFDIQANLFLYDGDTSAKKLIRESEKYDILVVTDLLEETEEEYLTYLKQRQESVISPNENLSGCLDNIICLNNYKAGELAARSLLKNGYKKPAFIGGRIINEYLPYENRSVGFANVLEEHNMLCKGSIRWINVDFYPDFVFEARSEVGKIVDEGFDSIFIFTDEFISLVCADVLRSHNSMKELGLITIAASKSALRFSPPIICINHATHKVAKELIKQMRLNLKEKTKFNSKSFAPSITSKQIKMAQR